MVLSSFNTVRLKGVYCVGEVAKDLHGAGRHPRLHTKEFWKVNSGRIDKFSVT